QPSYAEAIVPKGQKSEVVLPDSTHIWLNSGTRLRYPIQYGSGTRDVFLTGEAYFEVTPDKHKPFIVHAAQVNVKVLGTKFNVRAYSDDKDIETALLSGKVNLFVNHDSDNSKKLVMKPGDLIDYTKSNHIIQKTGFDADEVIGWKNNRLVFRDDTFNNLVKKIERWYNVQIIYDKSRFQKQRLTVELREGESIERLFQIIEKAINVDYRIEKQKIYVSPKKMKS
ncbi:MAG TPA: FecR domain-containing protein, partial [Sunxiuqinia sp.]|nr:FecR domain-containing protein [Sunxiuqinia sp.]